MKYFILFLAAIIISACGGTENTVPARENRISLSGGPVAGCKSRAYPEIGGPIALINQEGRAVTEADYAGAPVMVFFGFTYCPDVCPITLTTLRRAYDKLPDALAPPKTLLISVDPQRDTPEALRAYISKDVFPRDMDALTGTPQQVRAAANAFIADYSRVEQSRSLAEYTMDHTTLIYLMDENWQLKTFFNHTDTPDSIAACLKEQLAQ